MKRNSIIILLGLLVLVALAFNNMRGQATPLKCLPLPCPTALTSSRIYPEYASTFAVYVGGREIKSQNLEVTVTLIRDAGFTIAVSDKHLARQLSTWAYEGKTGETIRHVFTDTALSIENRYPSQSQFTVTYVVTVTATVPYGGSQVVVREHQAVFTRTQSGWTSTSVSSPLQLTWVARMFQVPDTRFTGPDPTAVFHASVSLTVKNVGSNPTLVSGFVQTSSGAYYKESTLPVSAAVTWSQEENDVGGLDQPWGIYILGKGEKVDLVMCEPVCRAVTFDVGFKKTDRVARFTEQTGSAAYNPG